MEITIIKIVIIILICLAIGYVFGMLYNKSSNCNSNNANNYSKFEGGIKNISSKRESNIDIKVEGGAATPMLTQLDKSRKNYVTVENEGYLKVVKAENEIQDAITTIINDLTNAKNKAEELACQKAAELDAATKANADTATIKRLRTNAKTSATKAATATTKLNEALKKATDGKLSSDTYYYCQIEIYTFKANNNVIMFKCGVEAEIIIQYVNGTTSYNPKYECDARIGKNKYHKVLGHYCFQIIFPESTKGHVIGSILTACEQIGHAVVATSMHNCVDGTYNVLSFSHDNLLNIHLVANDSAECFAWTMNDIFVNVVDQNNAKMLLTAIKKVYVDCLKLLLKSFNIICTYKVVDSCDTNIYDAQFNELPEDIVKYVQCCAEQAQYFITHGYNGNYINNINWSKNGFCNFLSSTGISWNIPANSYNVNVYITRDKGDLNILTTYKDIIRNPYIECDDTMISTTLTNIFDILSQTNSYNDYISAIVILIEIMKKLKNNDIPQRKNIICEMTHIVLTLYEGLHYIIFDYEFIDKVIVLMNLLVKSYNYYDDSIIINNNIYNEHTINSAIMSTINSDNVDAINVCNIGITTAVTGIDNGINNEIIDNEITKQVIGYNPHDRNVEDVLNVTRIACENKDFVEFVKKANRIKNITNSIHADNVDIIVPKLFHLIVNTYIDFIHESEDKVILIAIIKLLDIINKIIINANVDSMNDIITLRYFVSEFLNTIQCGDSNACDVYNYTIDNNDIGIQYNDPIILQVMLCAQHTIMKGKLIETQA